MSIKNNDYYTVNNSMLSKDNTILNDNQSENNKPGKAHNGFTEFMIAMLSIVIWILLTGIIVGPIAALIYYCYKIFFNFNNIIFVMSATIILGIGAGLLVYFITDKINIIANHILDKLENDDDTANSEAKKANTIEDKYNDAINDSNKRMGSAVAIGFMLLMALMIA